MEKQYKSIFKWDEYEKAYEVREVSFFGGRTDFYIHTKHGNLISSHTIELSLDKPELNKDEKLYLEDKGIYLTINNKIRTDKNRILYTCEDILTTCEDDKQRKEQAEAEKDRRKERIEFIQNNIDKYSTKEKTLLQKIMFWRNR